MVRLSHSPAAWRQIMVGGSIPLVSVGPVEAVELICSMSDGNSELKSRLRRARNRLLHGRYEGAFFGHLVA